MTWGLIAVAGTTLVGSVIAGSTASNAAGKAASAQEQGAREAAQIQREGLAQQQKQFDTSREDALRIYDQSRADLAPYRDVGTNALLALSDQLGIARPAGSASVNTGNPQFRKDPGYDFAFNEGLRAVDSRFPGMSRSGSKMKALTQYGQGMADQQYGNWLQRLSGIASVGQTATGQANSLGTNLTSTLANNSANNANALGAYSANAANLAENSAAARASGYVGSANAINSSISGGVNNLLALYGSGGFGGTKLPGQTSGAEWAWT